MIVHSDKHPPPNDHCSACTTLHTCAEHMLYVYIDTCARTHINRYTCMHVCRHIYKHKHIYVDVCVYVVKSVSRGRIIFCFTDGQTEAKRNKVIVFDQPSAK